jgi:hypothetical protein
MELTLYNTLIRLKNKKKTYCVYLAHKNGFQLLEEHLLFQARKIP